ncbi:U11/U12 small nuclear ribonucleoprotein 25 kDa protein isoform X2 [Thamnophis elegans]|uniref:U11/U12 small nuclear ribonucleoprotein 25 kDa protein isoform X2 n=1 Tax=Thamnophis elegans TaxID=35005 RepID=UPI001378515D|nr:U11/U12 small nuclear ribonucleoprotein 25 kDa protein isoform X2 [Thamnophis elegans]
MMEEEEEEAHAEAVDRWQAGLARLVRDPLLCDLPEQVALEYGQAMTVRVRRVDAPEAPMPVVVVQSASVLELKKALRRFVQLRQERQSGARHISWRHVWRTYSLTFGGEKLADDRKKLREYGIRNRDEVSFVKKLRQ